MLQKFFALAALGVIVGFIAGFIGLPYFEPPEPDMLLHDFELSVSGRTVFKCGQIWVAQAILGGLIGACCGLVIGLATAWWLPTPGERARRPVG